MNEKLSNALGKIMPSKELMQKWYKEIEVEERTGKCLKCGKNSHFGKCE